MTTLSSGPDGQVRHWDPVAFVFDAEKTVAAGCPVSLQARMGGNVLFFDIR